MFKPFVLCSNMQMYKEFVQYKKIIHILLKIHVIFFTKNKKNIYIQKKEADFGDFPQTGLLIKTK